MELHCNCDRLFWCYELWQSCCHDFDQWASTEGTHDKFSLQQRNFYLELV